MKDKSSIKTQVQQDRAESIRYMPKKLSYSDASVYNLHIRVDKMNAKLNQWLKKHNLYATGHFQKRTAA